MTDKPIDSIADLKRRKMWALPGVTANIIKATGSAVVAGPAVQMLQIISKGVVDGFVGVSFSSITSFKLTDYTKGVTVFPDKIFTPTFSFFISTKKWNTISPADRKAIRAVSGEKIARHFGQVQDGVNDRSRNAKLLKGGLEAIKGDPKMLAKLEGDRPADDRRLAEEGRGDGRRRQGGDRLLPQRARCGGCEAQVGRRGRCCSASRRSRRARWA